MEKCIEPMNDEPIFFSGFDACAFIQDLENQTN
jgi:hypothetical protein